MNRNELEDLHDTHQRLKRVDLAIETLVNPRKAPMDSVGVSFAHEEHLTNVHQRWMTMPSLDLLQMLRAYRQTLANRLDDAGVTDAS